MPARGWDMMPNPVLKGEEQGEAPWFAVIWNHDACLARSLARDMYCNAKWDVFSRLIALAPHGGSIG